MKVLSLFSGGGLGDFGLMAAGMEIKGQVEIDDYCQKILDLRFPETIKWKDIKNVTGKEIKEKCGTIDLVAGGFPCQPFSVAGNQRGDQDDRHLWPEMLRIIQEVQPRYVLGENVAGIIPIALDDVLNDLETLGYTTASFVFPAHACGAPHRRDRLWIVGYAEHLRRPRVQESKGLGTRKGTSEGPERPEQPSGSSSSQGRIENVGDASIKGLSDRGRPSMGESTGEKSESERSNSPSDGSQDVGYSISKGLEGFSGDGERRHESGRVQEKKERSVGETGLLKTLANTDGVRCEKGINKPGKKRQKIRGSKSSVSGETLGESKGLDTDKWGWVGDSRWWESEPPVGRVANGVAHRVDRLKVLGNGQVVHCVKFIGDRIMEFENGIK